MWAFISNGNLNITLEGGRGAHNFFFSMPLLIAFFYIFLTVSSSFPWDCNKKDKTSTFMPQLKSLKLNHGDKIDYQEIICL